MNDEIKEILKTMKTFNGNLIVENTEVTTLCLTKKESKLLLDYITNLQQDIANYVDVVLHDRKIIDNLQQKLEQYENPDDLTLFYMWLDEKAKDKMKELQQENEKLKESIGELANRNVEASVYIQENIIGNYFKRYDDEIYKMCDDLLDILKGGSNE